jgi:hypothetical protein
MAKYLLTFSDGSPELETSTLLDEQDAFSFAKVVAEAMGLDENKPPPEVVVHAPNGAAVKAKNRPLTCMRCHSVQALRGIENTSDGMCFTFTCTDCRLVETRTVTRVKRH